MNDREREEDGGPHVLGGPNFVDGLDVAPLHYRTAAEVLRARDREVFESLKAEAKRREAQARLDAAERVRRAEGAARLDKLLALAALREGLGRVYRATAAHWKAESTAARAATVECADALDRSRDELNSFLQLRDSHSSERERELVQHIDEARADAAMARGGAERAIASERLVWRREMAELELSLRQTERRAADAERELARARAESGTLREGLRQAEAAAAVSGHGAEALADVRAHARKAAELDAWWRLAAERSEVAAQHIQYEERARGEVALACERVRAEERAAGARVLKGALAHARKRIISAQLGQAVLIRREHTRALVDKAFDERERAARRIQLERRVLQARYGTILSVARALGLAVRSGADATGVFAAHALGGALSRTHRPTALPPPTTAALFAAADAADAAAAAAARADAPSAEHERPDSRPDSQSGSRAGSRPGTHGSTRSPHFARRLSRACAQLAPDSGREIDSESTRRASVMSPRAAGTMASFPAPPGPLSSTQPATAGGVARSRPVFARAPTLPTADAPSNSEASGDRGGGSVGGLVGAALERSDEATAQARARGDLPDVASAAAAVALDGGTVDALGAIGASIEAAEPAKIFVGIRSEAEYVLGIFGAHARALGASLTLAETSLLGAAAAVRDSQAWADDVAHERASAVALSTFWHERWLRSEEALARREATEQVSATALALALADAEATVDSRRVQQASRERAILSRAEAAERHAAATSRQAAELARQLQHEQLRYADYHSATQAEVARIQADLDDARTGQANSADDAARERAARDAAARRAESTRDA